MTSYAAIRKLQPLDAGDFVAVVGAGEACGVQAISCVSSSIMPEKSRGLPGGAFSLTRCRPLVLLVVRYGTGSVWIWYGRCSRLVRKGVLLWFERVAVWYGRDLRPERDLHNAPTFSIGSGL